MKLIKDFALFFIISALIIIGVLFFLKQETDIIRDEMQKESKKNIKVVQLDSKNEIKNINLKKEKEYIAITDPLNVKIDLICQKGEMVLSIIQRIEESSEVILNYNKSDLKFENDLGMHIYDISLKEVFEILLGEKFFWYNKKDNIINILRK